MIKHRFKKTCGYRGGGGGVKFKESKVYSIVCDFCFMVTLV